MADPLVEVEMKSQSPRSVVVQPFVTAAVLLLFFTFVLGDLQYGLVSAGVWICVGIPQGLWRLRHGPVRREPLA